MPSAAGIAREVFTDYNESIDAQQVLGPGGNVLVGETSNGLIYGTGVTTDNLTARAGGGQALATKIPPRQIVRFSTVANVGDSGVLPPSVAGFAITIINDGAQNMNVFPAVGESINALAANTALAVVPGTPTIFYCVSNGVWHTK